MRGKALQKLEEGYMKFSGNGFFFFQHSANFLIKDKNMDRDVPRKHVLEVSGWGVGEYTGLVKCEEKGNPSSK